MTTATRTATRTVASGDTNYLTQKSHLDLAALTRAFPGVTLEFEARALEQVRLLFAHGMITGVQVQFYNNEGLIREYRFQMVNTRLEAFGPAAGQPPLGELPANCRLRLTVNPNPEVPAEQRRAWFDRLGWSPCENLELPGVSPVTYGVFNSGNRSMERQLLVNPRYAGRSAQMIPKEPRR